MGYVDPTRGSGTRQTPEYSTWKHMKGRCQNPTDANFADYGGRGIKVCDRWQNFDNFLEDMGQRPASGWSIERDDVDGNYEPGNCFWTPPGTQQGNQRRTHRVEVNGVEMSLHAAAVLLGKNPVTVQNRVRLGWSPDDALHQPVRTFSYFPFRGGQITLRAFERQYGITRHQLRKHINLGKSLEELVA